MVMTVLPVSRGRKVDDGQSVRVTAPAAMVVDQGDYAVVEGFHGMNVSEAKTQTTAAQDIVLQTDGAEYESVQIVAADAFAAVGTLVYFDPAASLLTQVNVGPG